MDLSVGVLWAAAGVLTGFQVTALTFRVNREIYMDNDGQKTWLPLADGLNLLSMAVTLVGVFILPVLDEIALDTAAELFGLAVLLLLGYAVALVGHYDLYDPRTRRSKRYCPLQERVALAAVGVAAVTYLAAAFG